MGENKQGRVVLISTNCPDLGTPNIELKNFPDGEKYVRLPSLSQCEGKEVVLAHRCYPEQDKSLIQLLLMLSALKNSHAKRIIAIVPYLPYARQDKIWKEGEAKSSETICSLIAGAGCDLLVTFDCHFIKHAGDVTYGGLHIKNLTMRDALIEHFQKISKDAIVAAPDKGASYMVSLHGGRSMSKARGEYSKEGDATMRPISTLEMGFDVNGKDVILIDDMIAGGGTMAKAAANCKKGGAKKIYCASTHGLFLGNALPSLKEAGAADIAVSDSIDCPSSKIPIMPHLKDYL